VNPEQLEAIKPARPCERAGKRSFRWCNRSVAVCSRVDAGGEKGDDFGGVPEVVRTMPVGRTFLLESPNVLDSS